MVEPEGRFEAAVDAFFAIHKEDPRTVARADGSLVPWSVVYHERMREWLTRIEPEAGEPLRLAVCCQHIRRWKIPRATYPDGKLGYKKWRRDLAVFHGDQAAEILEGVGYEAATIDRVRELLLKTGLKEDAEVQVLEDVICLVFLEKEFADFADKHEEEKIASILRKTWKKMSDRGHEEAKRLAAQLPEDLRSLVGRALGQA